MPELEETLLGPLVAGRVCGDCAACCASLKIDTPDLAKAAGMPCLHSRGAGCDVYSVRPHICRTWYCAWRRIGTMSDASRPDRSGILAFLGFNQTPRNCLEGVYLVAQADRREAFDTPAGREIVAELGFGLIPVWISYGATKTLVHPAAEIARYVISAGRPPAHLAETVAAWRARYDVFRP